MCLKVKAILPVQPAPSEHLQRKDINVVKIADGSTLTTDQLRRTSSIVYFYSSVRPSSLCITNKEIPVILYSQHMIQYGTAQVQGNVRTRQKRVQDASKRRARHVQGASGTNAIPHDKAARRI